MHTELQEEYINCLLTDLETQKKLVGDRNVVSIFFGGGTPSLMKPDYIQRIIGKIDSLFTLNKDVEITLEANPTSSNIEKFKGFKQAGINRLSIGIQSLNDTDLKFLGREHNSAQALQTISDALYTFSNVSFDLIYGLPDQNLKNWEEQLLKAIDFGTHHLSAYQLTIEPNTAFFSQVKKNLWQPMEDDLQADFFEKTREIFNSHNFNHYEISNFAKEGYHCKHNYNIWQYGDYIGIGAGAHGRIQDIENVRYSTQNYKMPAQYINSVKHVEHGFHAKKALSEQLVWQEKILMGLRTHEGVPQTLFEDKIATSQAINLFLQTGMLHKKSGNIALTNKGQLLLDSILENILEL